MFGKKKKKEKKEKKSKKEQKETDQISSNRILIRVYKDFGSSTPHLKAEYKAVEKRDMYNNLVSINEKYLHNEDTDFAIDEVYDTINITLELGNKNQEEKLKILKEKVNYQNNLIKFLDKFVELNSVFNYLDEELKRRDLEILKEKIEKHDGLGSYFTIEKGLRVYSFESRDGFLVPIWHGMVTHTQYPDHTRKKKIAIQEDIIMKQELAQYNRDKKIGNLLTWGLVFNIILFAILIFSGYKVWETHNNMEIEISESAQKCADYTSNLNREFAFALKNNFIQQLQNTPTEVIEPESKPLEPPNVIS